MTLPGTFGVIFLGYAVLYFSAAGTAYWWFYIRKAPELKHLRIQERYPSRKSVQHEIRWSVRTLFVVSVLTTGTWLLVQGGYTRVYTEIGSRGIFYFALSIFGGILINDTYFYWVHRFMHLKWVFPWVHRVHHLSKTPTPWAIFSFSPAEAFLNFLVFPLLLFLLPMHLLAFGAVFGYNIVLNVTGHLGFEIVPQRLRRFWMFRMATSVTHHEMHHAKVKWNYGLYFNFWDWLMKTNHADYEKIYHKNINT